MRSLLPDRSQSIHRQLAHSPKHMFHSYPDPASLFVYLLVLFAYWMVPVALELYEILQLHLSK